MKGSKELWEMPTWGQMKAPLERFTFSGSRLRHPGKSLQIERLFDPATYVNVIENGPTAAGKLNTHVCLLRSVFPGFVAAPLRRAEVKPGELLTCWRTDELLNKGAEKWPDETGRTSWMVHMPNTRGETDVPNRKCLQDAKVVGMWTSN